MKKVLLIAVAALIAGTANAQTSGRGKVVKAKGAPVINVGHQMSMANREVKPMKSALLNGPVKNSLAKPFKMDANQISTLKPAFRLNQATVRRAGELQSKYNGTGTNYQTKQAATWTMGTATQDGTTYLIDVIPLPEDWASLEYIAVPCVINGNTITVAPTVVASTEDSYFFLHSWASSDGSIVLTLEEDGSLTTIDGEDIAYSRFSSNEFSLADGGPYKGLVLDIEKVKYLKEGQVVAPLVGYEPQGLFLHPGPNVNGNYYTNLLIPAYGDIQLKSWTDMACDSYSWQLQPVAYDAAQEATVPVGDPIESSEANLTFNSGTTNYAPASLVATAAGVASETFAWNTATWYAGGADSDWESEGTPTITMTKANPAAGLTYFNPTGVKSTIHYQGKPASPLYFNGITLFVYQFAQTEGQELTFTCKIHKAHRDDAGRFSLGELVAQADVESVEEGTWMAGQLVRLHWDHFYIEDELGLSVDLPYLILDEEFAVVFEGWNNGTFTGYPLAFTSVLPTGGMSSTYAILPDQTTYVRSGWNGTFDAVVGFTGATYGYLHTNDATDLTIPAEGGTVAVSNIEPMYISSDDAGQIVTSLWIENEDDAPDWVTPEIVNEVYTDTEGHFDLKFTADALPEGTTGRTGQFVFAQRGALLKVTVTQGEVTGIAAAKAEVKAGNAQMFNLAGQRVSNSYKGLVIKNGKKMLNK